MAETALRRIVPPPEPVQFWMTDALRPLHAKLTAWVAAGCPAGEQEYLSSDEFLEYCRLRGKGDLYFFGRFILGNDWLEPEYHGPLGYVWTCPNGTNHHGKIYGSTRCAIEPRSHLKTTFLTQHWALQRIVRDPLERGLLFTHSYEFGVKLLNPIKMLLQGQGTIGQFFITLYPELVPPRNAREKWKENLLTVGREMAFTDASLEVSAPGAKLTGSHFTFEAIDDSQDRVLSREMVRKICQQLDNLLPMLVGTGQCRITATPWGFGDVLAYLTRNFKSPVIVSHRQWEENDVPLLKGLAAEGVRERALDLKKRNPFLFSCFYLTNPTDDEKHGFRKAWFKYFQLKGTDIVELDLDGKPARKVDIRQCHCFILVDPTSGRTPAQQRGDVQGAAADTDLVGLIVLHVGPDNTWYVTQARGERWSVDQLVDELFTLTDYYQPKFVAIEQRGVQYIYKHVLLAEFKRRGRVFAFRDWIGGMASKDDRIRSLLPRYHNGMIFHREADNETLTAGIELLEQQLLEHPTGQHDDLPDALSAAGPLVWAKGALRPVEAKALATQDTKALRLDRASRAEAKWVTQHMTGEHRSEFWANA